MLFANTWSIHRTSEYEDADDFVPERFMLNDFGIKNKTTNGTPDAMRRRLYGFGAGRRVCSGQRLAENSLVCNQNCAALLPRTIVY
jgi:cytochrome P450